jgi:transaldolase
MEPEFDLSRLIMKVPSTWEGMQASRRLKADGIKTLATTAFTMEQVVLAGEAGCISISPFAHELRAHSEDSYVGSVSSKHALLMIAATMTQNQFLICS